ncbi:patatin-like phospholipase family protein [Tamlana haliotis]|uniref:Patatin-like phospholipase family protein n=2 Tax=Pseudotamlana haliotis TaxID=2614804 RepID=A0A6N6MPN9_9FLAO|nr:patatin-like phospholipase family protein [Tamlana haliotis]
MLKVNKIFCVIVLLFSLQFHCNAQDKKLKFKKPKVALVLSGGGAKGIAHIPVLQKLDSLGIVPDLVVGTSMGSVVGGLYAMGYSGNEISAILNKLNWSDLLGGSVTLAKVGNEEKSEFGHYLLGLNWKNKKPSISTGILNDQNLRELLATLTYPVYNVHDFDRLPIPYRAIATDIVEGKEVVMKEGSLLTAMRASMSIPSVFKPVDYKDMLLVDGGVLNNFPADVAKELGADIIIGSDVGGGLKKKSELNNIATILFQTSMLVSNIKNPENRKLCDVLIDHTPNLTYSTGDFKDSNEIFTEGKIATNTHESELVALAEKLKPYKQRQIEMPKAPKEFEINEIIYRNISKGNLNLVKSRINLEAKGVYTPSDMVNGIDRLMGTDLFNQIVVVPKVRDSLIDLDLSGVENSKHQVKFSLHFDTYRGLGLIANYTGRNILGDASRTLITLDIAEQPKFRLQHQKIFGEKHLWWWRTEFLWQKLKQKIYFDGYGVDGIRSNTFQFQYALNRNFIPNKSYLGLGIVSERNSLEPKISFGVDSASDLDKYKYNEVGLDLHFNYNSLNQVFFANNGAFLHAVIEQPFVHHADLAFEDSAFDFDGRTNGFTKANVVYERRLPLTPRLTAIIGGTGAFTFEHDLKDDEISYDEFGLGGKYFIGGNLKRPSRDTFIFNGLNEDELTATQFIALTLGMQYNLMNKLYVKPHTSLGVAGFKGFGEFVDTAFSPKGSWSDAVETSALFSVGSTFSYHSIIGPINVDVSYINDLDAFRVFLGVGLQFGRTN